MDRIEVMYEERLGLQRTAVRVALVTAAIALLSGCATGKSVRGADYDVVINVTEKHSKVSHTNLSIRCGDPGALGAVPECFSVRAGLEGRRDVDGYTYYTFRSEGAQVLQMPYGVYNFDSLGHSVVVDTERTVNCYVNKKNQTICNPITKDIKARHSAKPPTVNAIAIEPGVGCYAGHLTVEMTESSLPTYEFDQSANAPSAEILERLPVALQAAVEGHVIQPCVPG